MLNVLVVEEKKILGKEREEIEINKDLFDVCFRYNKIGFQIKQRKSKSKKQS